MGMIYMFPTSTIKKINKIHVDRFSYMRHRPMDGVFRGHGLEPNPQPSNLPKASIRGVGWTPTEASYV